MKQAMKITALAVCLLCFALTASAFDYIDINYDCGDKTYFHSDYLSDIGDTYRNCIVADKGNTVKFNRCLERYNPNRTDNSIYMEKINENDCHMDISLIKKYPYVLVRSYAKTDNYGALTHLCYIRDSISNATKYDEDILKITPEGKLVSSDGAILMSVENGSWFHYAVAIDTLNHTASIYINGSLVKTGLAISSNINHVNMVRVWLDYGNNGNVSFDELEVTAMRNPYTGDESNYSSVFHNDDGIEAYLKDKSAFHAFSGSVSAGGVKQYTETMPILDEELKELFVPVESLNIGYGLSLTEENNCITGNNTLISDGDKNILYNGIGFSFTNAPILRNGHVMVPVKEFASKVLRHNVFDDRKGLVITSLNTINLDLTSEVEEYKIGSSIYPHTNIKSINWYMFFERPSAEQIREKFNIKTDNGAMHPRVLVTADDFENIKNQRISDTYLNNLCLYLINKADAVLYEQPDEYEIPDNQRLLTIARRILQRMEYLGFAYQLTGDQKYADCAWKLFEKVGTYPDWNPSHMIDVGELNFAYAIGYDWMYDGFTEQKREYIFNTAKKFGMNVTRLAYYGRLGGGGQYANESDKFVRWKSNFNTVINGGTMAAALAFTERDEELCFDILEKSIRSLEYTFIGFIPDGAWIESASYWDYLMSFLSKGVGSLTSSVGTDFGLMKFQGMSKTAMFYRSLDSFQGGNNFHDVGKGRLYSSRLSWLAKVYNTPECFAMRKAQLYSAPNVLDIYDVLWYIPNCTATENNLPLDVYTRGIESFSARSSYSDKNGMYTSAHGGLVFCYHSQADVGSFVYDILGERWACDLGAEDYNVQRDGSTGYYSAYRRRAEAHNVIVIKPNTSSKDGGQVESAFVPMIDFQSSELGARAVYDMTSAYEPYVNDYKRGFYVDESRTSLTVRDELSLKGSSEVNWFMTTTAEVEICENNLIKLTKNKKTVNIKFETNAQNIEVSVTDCSALLGEPQLEGQNLNEGYSRIRIKLISDADVYIQTSLSPGDYAEEWSLRTPKVSYDFSGASLNSLDLIIDSIGGGSAKVYHTPEVLKYDVSSGIFGREQTDKSLHLWNGESYSDFFDLYQFVEYDFTGACEIQSGQAAEISFYTAFDGSNSSKYIDAFVYAEGTPETNRKNSAMFCINRNGEIIVWGRNIPGIKLRSQKWYKISIVSVGGDASYADNPNMFYLYIDDKLIYSDTFIPNWRGINKDKFLGFEKLWIGQQVRDGELIDNGCYKTSDFYLDDLKIFKYENPIDAAYTPVHLYHDDYNIRKYITQDNGLSIYLEDGTSLGDIGKGFTGAEAVVVDKTGNIVVNADAVINDLYLRIRRKNGSYLFTDFITDKEAYFNYNVPEKLTTNTLISQLNTSIKNFTELKYLNKTAGKEEGDYSIVLETNGYDGMYDHNAPYVGQIFGTADMKPTHIEFNVCMMNTLCDAPVNIYIIYKDEDLVDKWCKIMKLIPNGQVLDNYGMIVGNFAQNKWIKITMSFYPSLKSVDLRINGILVKEGMDFDFGTGFKELVRYKAEQAFPTDKSELYSGSFGIDDFNIYRGAFDISSVSSAIYNVKSFTAVKDGNNLSVNASIGCRQYNAPITLAVVHYKDNKLYDIKLKNETLYQDINLNSSLVAEKECTVQFDCTLENTENSQVKIMLLSGIEKMMPLTDAMIMGRDF